MRRSSSSRSDILSARALGRATLARQLLLGPRARITPLAAIEALAGMQAQVPRPPFIGLWSRVAGFERAQLHALVHARKAVRATLMRGTIHLVSARDFLTLRAALQPMLSSLVGRRMDGFDIAALVAHGRTMLPANFEALRAGIAARFPTHDRHLLGYALRLHLPLVLVPTETRWSYAAQADFHCAETWLSRAPAAAAPATLVRRYLAAFGPASVRDAQAWSGLRTLAPVFEALRPKLRVFHDDAGRELFDLPDAPRPPDDTDAPVRLLPEYDNLVLAYADPSRIVSRADRPALSSKNGIIAATFLVDGRVAGTWELARKGAVASLRLEPFARLPRATLAAVRTEAEALLRWHEPDATSFKLR